jgi:transposase
MGIGPSSEEGTSNRRHWLPDLFFGMAAPEIQRQHMRPGHRLLVLLNAIAWRIVIAISFLALLIGLGLLYLEWPPSEIRAAASLNYSTIDYAKVTCVSIVPHQVVVEGKEATDPRLAKLITDDLSIKSVLFDAPYSQCPWDFFINITAGTEYSVRNGFSPAQYVIAVGICERTDDTHPNSDHCLNKNVYVFNWRANLHDLFRVAILGLRPETPNMKLITMKVGDD